MNITLLRLRYAQLLVIALLGVFLYTMKQSLAGNFSQFGNNLWKRELLITSFTELRLALGDHIFSQVLVAKEGWLVYTNEKDIDSYQNVINTSPTEWEATQQNLQKLYEELHERNITLLLVIPPNKATIYPDKIPDEIQKLNPESNLDAFANYIEQHGPPVFLDLRPALQEGRTKEGQDIYYKTDTHWNGYGAFIAYQEIMNALSKKYPQLKPIGIQDFKIIPQETAPTDLSRLIGANYLTDPKFILSPKRLYGIRWDNLNNDSIPSQVSITFRKKSPSLLMYLDSFGVPLKNMLAPHFSQATFIHHSSIYPDLVSLKTLDIVEPNIVIVEIVERFFNNQALDFFLSNFITDNVTSTSP